MGFQNIKNSRLFTRHLTTSKLLIKENTKKLTETTTPVLFEAKLNLFKIGLKAELFDIKSSISSDNAVKKSMVRNQSFYNLRAEKVYYHALHGRVIELCDDKLIGLNTSIFPIKKPFSLKQKDKQFLSYVMNYNPDNGTILLKLKSSTDEWRKLKQNTFFDLLPSAKSPLDSVLHFLKSGGFTKMPGWKTVESIYNESKSLIVYSDKPVKFDGQFNTSQQNAIKAALNPARQILCIGGPPGTGKAQVTVEILKQLLEDGKKILVVVAGSKVSMNMIEGIDLKKYKTCSIVGGEIINMDGKTKSRTEFENLEYMSSLISESKRKNANSKHLRDYSNLAIGARHGININIIKESQIIFTSRGSSGINLIEKAKFIPDVVLFEEGSQITECVSWRFMLSGKRSIVIGDHSQFIKSLNFNFVEKHCQLDISTIEYLWNNLPKTDKIMLDTQYRMNNKIMEWTSKTFYENAIKADKNVENITLSDIYSVKHDDKFNSPLLVFDSRKCPRFKEIKVRKSFANVNEVLVCAKYVKYLLSNGLKKSDIGIMTPYSAQKIKIEEHLKGHNIKVSTVDGFQGQQKEVIIFSYVRNNKSKNVGFLSEKKRMNVALTRAKRQFVFIGNTDMLSIDNTFEELRNIFLNEGISIDAGRYLLKNEK